MKNTLFSILKKEDLYDLIQRQFHHNYNWTTLYYVNEYKSNGFQKEST